MDATRLNKVLRGDEGLELKPYKDSVGKLTIGVGRNLDDVGITDSEATLLLSNDIDKVVRGLDEIMPWWRKMNEVRQGVLANMAFNMGLHSLSSFTNTLRFMESGDYDLAARGMMNSLWAKQVGKRAERLAQEMESGVYDGEL